MRDKTKKYSTAVYESPMGYMVRDGLLLYGDGWRSITMLKHAFFNAFGKPIEKAYLPKLKSYLINTDVGTEYLCYCNRCFLKITAVRGDNPFEFHEVKDKLYLHIINGEIVFTKSIRLNKR